MNTISHEHEKFENTKWIIKICKSKKHRQYNDQIRTKDQTMIYKTQHGKLKIKQHENLNKNRGELRCFGRVSSFCFTSGTHRVTLVTNLMISHK